MVTEIHTAYLEHWNPNCQYLSRLQSYQALNRECELAEYHFTIRDTKQKQILSEYKLSVHSLAIEKGRQNKDTAGTEVHFFPPLGNSSTIFINKITKYQMSVN